MRATMTAMTGEERELSKAPLRAAPARIARLLARINQRLRSSPAHGPKAIEMPAPRSSPGLWGLTAFTALANMNPRPPCSVSRYQPPGRASRRVSEWLAATLEMWCPARGCGFEPRALRCCSTTLAAALLTEVRTAKHSARAGRGHTAEACHRHCGRRRLGGQRP